MAIAERIGNRPAKPRPAGVELGRHRAPRSSGAPEGACDCHMHIYDPARFPMPPSPSGGSVQCHRVRLPVAAEAIGNDARGRCFSLATTPSTTGNGRCDRAARPECQEASPFFTRLSRMPS